MCTLYTLFMSPAFEYSFSATIQKMPGGVPSWSVVLLPNSREVLGTGKAVKIIGTVDGYPIETAFLPVAAADHLLPMSAKLRKAIGKDLGDEVEVVITQRLD